MYSQTLSITVFSLLTGRSYSDYPEPPLFPSDSYQRDFSPLSSAEQRYLGLSLSSTRTTDLPEPQVTSTYTGVVCPNPLQRVPQLPDNFVYRVTLEASIGSVGLLTRSVLTVGGEAIHSAILWSLGMQQSPSSILG